MKVGFWGKHKKARTLNYVVLLSQLIILCFAGWIYVIEMALKVYSFGFENYWRDGQNRFDFIITLIIGN